MIRACLLLARLRGRMWVREATQDQSMMVVVRRQEVKVGEVVVMGKACMTNKAWGSSRGELPFCGRKRLGLRVCLLLSGGA